MTHPDDDLQTRLPDLHDIPLNELESIRHPLLAMSIRVLLDRRSAEQDPLNSFQAAI